jgi:hypothetical protein
MSDQLWAWIMVVTGVLTTLVCHHVGIAAEIGAGICGAGINAFTKAELKKNNT